MFARTLPGVIGDNPPVRAAPTELGRATGVVVTINMTLLAELGRFPALGMVIGSSPEAMHQNTEAGAHKLTTTGFDGATGAPTCNRLVMSFFTQSRLETGAPSQFRRLRGSDA